MKSRLYRTIGTLLICGSVGVAALAQGSPALNVKLGLWEMAIDMGGAGMAMPNIDLSKMTPEQQAALAQAMRGRGMSPAGGAMTIKNCMTKEKLANAQFKQTRPGQDCKQKITKSTTTTLDLTETCTSTTQPAVTTTSDIHIEALSPTSVKMVATQTGGERGGQPMAVTMTGKWVQADCGDVK